MSFQRFGLVLLLAFTLMPSLTFASSANYNYISAAELESRLTSSSPINIVDIQVEAEFSQHHIKGATPTYAYPVKSDADRAKLDGAITQLNANSDPIVIVCPRGGGGAKRTYDYLLGQGVPVKRLLILEKGQSGWSSAALMVGE